MKLLVLALALAASVSAQVKVERGEYHGWKDAVILHSASAWAVIVPSIGRVMQFGPIDNHGGMTDGPFFNNRALDGKPVDANSPDWINFGGDKSWPESQSAWPQITGRAWPPPVAFDSSADAVEISGGTVTLTSPVDPHYGIRERRVISLDSTKPEMIIRTTCEKVEGDPVETGIWVITQLESPDGASASRPRDSRFSSGYTNLSGPAPLHLKAGPAQITEQRDPSRSTKIGTDGDVLTWTGGGMRLRIERLADADGADPKFPDSGCHIEIYTNPDPLPYIEMETMGPLHTMRKGDRITAANVYTLTELPGK